MMDLNDLLDRVHRMSVSDHMDEGTRTLAEIVSSDLRKILHTDPYNIAAQHQWAVENCPPLSEWGDQMSLMYLDGLYWKWCAYDPKTSFGKRWMAGEPDVPLGIDYRVCKVTREERAAWEASQDD